MKTRKEIEDMSYPAAQVELLLDIRDALHAVREAGDKNE